MKLNIRNTIIFLMFGIYPIIPQYFGIMGISAFKLMCLGIVLFAYVFLEFQNQLLLRVEIFRLLSEFGLLLCLQTQYFLKVLLNIL